MPARDLRYPLRGRGLYRRLKAGNPFAGITGYESEWNFANSVVSGGTISRVFDSGPNGNDLVQGTAGLQPAFNSAGYGTFNADLMTAASTVSLGTSWTVAAVYQATSFALVSYLIGANGTGFYTGGSTAGVNGYGAYDGTNVREANTEPTTKGLVMWQPTKLYRGGVEPTYDDTGTIGAMSITTIGKRTDTPPDLWYYGHIWHIVAFKAVLSTADLNTVGSTLSTLHGLSWTAI